MTDDSATLRATELARFKLPEIAKHINTPSDDPRYRIVGYVIPVDESVSLHSQLRMLEVLTEAFALLPALLASQSSWAKEKEELERLRDEEKAKAELYGEAVSLISLLRYGGIITITGDIRNKLEAFMDKARELPKRHASRPVTAKE